MSLFVTVFLERGLESKHRIIFVLYTKNYEFNKLNIDEKFRKKQV
jgi:hypothetical protein